MTPVLEKDFRSFSALSLFSSRQNFGDPKAPAEQEVPAMRLRLSVRANPRIEMRAGFPKRAPQDAQPVRALRSERLSDEAIPSCPPSAVVAAPLRAAPQSVEIPLGPARQSMNVVEMLIERTKVPTPLPGLQVRLLDPPARPRPNVAEAQATEEPTARERPAPASPSPPPFAPPLDINAVADKVYQTLLRRQQFERDRRGFY